MRMVALGCAFGAGSGLTAQWHGHRSRLGEITAEWLRGSIELVRLVGFLGSLRRGQPCVPHPACEAGRAVEPSGSVLASSGSLLSEAVSGLEEADGGM